MSNNGIPKYYNAYDIDIICNGEPETVRYSLSENMASEFLNNFIITDKYGIYFMEVVSFDEKIRYFINVNSIKRIEHSDREDGNIDIAVCISGNRVANSVVTKEQHGIIEQYIKSARLLNHINANNFINITDRTIVNIKEITMLWVISP